MNEVKLACVSILLLVLSLGCLGEKAPIQTGAPLETAKVPETAGSSLASQGFENGGSIPIKYTCYGKDLSPPLSWGTPNASTKSLVLIVDDPDAPGSVFTHWILFNLPADVGSLPEGVPKLDRLENGGLQGVNDFKEKGYSGPCPPPGKPHTYRFILYSLDAVLNLDSGATREEVLKAMEGHVLTKAELDGKYGR